jgi:N-acetylglucosamine-6-phosphate deacetylase
MSGMHHREPGLAGYALSDHLYVEVIADFAHVHPEMLRLVLRSKPPSRVILVSDSLAAAKTPGVPENGPLYLEDGNTLAGSGITLADAVKNIVSLGVPGETAAAFAGANPCRYLENGLHQ